MAYNITNNTEYITYEVHDGDTYSSIASDFNITISDLILLNDFDAYDLNTIYVGSILRVGIRDKTTGRVIETNNVTDNEIESVFKEASLQAISVDSVTQNTLNNLKETYSQNGTLDSIKNDLLYLQHLGYTNDEINLLLNDYSINIDMRNSAIRKVLEKAEKDESGSTAYDDSDLSKDTILGLPFRYNTYADPRRRVFNSSFMTDALVVSIIPGKPLFRGVKDDTTNKGAISSIIDFFDSEDDSSILDAISENLLDSENEDSVYNWLLSSQKSNVKNGDLRYYRFKEDYPQFLKYLDINISTLASKMGIGNLKNARYKNFMTNIESDSFFGISRAFKFFGTKAGSSISESISNSFDNSTISNTINQFSDTLQEFNFLTGGDISQLSGTATKVTGAIGELVSSLASAIGLQGTENSIRSMESATSLAVSGNKMIWPQIWKDSSFQRSYNFTFEFISPYGTPEAIFRYVYLPFLTLLTLASPKQYGTAGYGSPFLCRIDVPGYMTSDLAVIQNITWRKGGNDGLFTNDGLPLAMTVEITVQDLYPNIAIAGEWSELRANTGMHGFLDNLAGLSVQRFSPWQNIKNSILVRSASVIGSIDRFSIENDLSTVYSISTKSLFGSPYNQ